jgi:ADP-ribose pyrophosphatase YjhB (NUDIX family)
MKLPLAASVVIVVECDGRILMIEEDRGAVKGPIWYFPAGALEAGESLADAARRETREETGYEVEPVALVALDHGTFREPDGLHWWRFVVSARLIGSQGSDRPATAEPFVKRIAWFATDELQGLPLRNRDAVELCKRLDAGRELPLDRCVLSPDGTLEGFFM